VSWRDGAGLQHNKYLPKRAAQELYDQVCAQKLFEKSGISHTLGKKATNLRNLKFKDLAERYLNEHLLALTRSESNKYYVQILIHKWGDYPLSMLDSNEFKKWVRFALTNPTPTPKKGTFKLTPLSASSVKKLVRYMTRVFYWSMQEGIINHNPFANIIPKSDPLNKEFRRQMRFKPVVLTLDEFWPMADFFPSEVRNPAIACFFSGIRRGELAAIRWSKINRKERRFEFEAIELKEADSKNVYYDAELEPVLESLEIDYIANGYKDDIVFRNEKGGALTEDSFTHSVRYYCDRFAEKAGNTKYRKVTPHTFRRSYRTRKDREGVDRKAVCANMGHHSETTSELYNIVDDERQRSVAGSLSGCPEEIRRELEGALLKAKSAGMELSEVQTEVRMAWRNLCYSVLRPDKGENDGYA
jgi:integrase